MKSIISVFTFCCLMAGGSLFAQGKTIGVKGGVNFSTLAVDKAEIDDANYRTGITVGIYKQAQVSPLLSFQSELLFNTKGAEYEVTGRNVEAQLSYLELPLSLQLHLGKSPLFIYGGGNIGFLLGAKYEYESGFFEDGQDIVKYDDLDGFNRFNAGLHAGAGLQLNILTLDARVSRGLTNVEEDRTVNALLLEGNDTKNFSIQFTAGIAF